MIMRQSPVLYKLAYFYGKIDAYMIIYKYKDKNTTQGSLTELVGSPVALI